VGLLLLAQDGLPDRLKREEWRAVRSRVEAGEGSRAALEEAARGGDPDAAFYAQAALAELDRLRSGEFAAVPRTRRTEVPAARALADLFKSGGLDFSPAGLPERSLNFPEGLSFGEALEAASRDLGMEFEPGEEGTWKAAGPFLDVPRFASGTVRARLEKASRGTYWRPGLPPAVYLWLAGRVDGLGRFGSPPLYADVRIVEAVDEHGRDLRWRKDWHEESIRLPYKQRAPEGKLSLSLQAPDLKTTRVSRLRLAADFCFRKKEGTIAFEKPAGARGVKKRLGDVEATLVRAGMEGDKFNVELKVRAPGIAARIAGDEEALFGPGLEPVLADAEGRPWEKRNGGSGHDGREYSFEADYRSEGGAGPPAVLRFTLVTEVETRSLYFEFRDVSLP